MECILFMECQWGSGHDHAGGAKMWVGFWAEWTPVTASLATSLIFC